MIRTNNVSFHQVETIQTRNRIFRIIGLLVHDERSATRLLRCAEADLSDGPIPPKQLIQISPMDVIVEIFDKQNATVTAFWQRR